MPCFAQPDPTAGYDWNADAGQVSMLLAAVELGADTLEAFVNSPPWFWTVSGSSRWGVRRLGEEAGVAPAAFLQGTVPTADIRGRRTGWIGFKGMA